MNKWWLVGFVFCAVVSKAQAQNQCVEIFSSGVRNEWQIGSLHFETRAHTEGLSSEVGWVELRSVEDSSVVLASLQYSKIGDGILRIDSFRQQGWTGGAYRRILRAILLQNPGTHRIITSISNAYYRTFTRHFAAIGDRDRSLRLNPVVQTLDGLGYGAIVSAVEYQFNGQPFIRLVVETQALDDLSQTPRQRGE